MKEGNRTQSNDKISARKYARSVKAALRCSVLRKEKSCKNFCSQCFNFKYSIIFSSAKLFTIFGIVSGVTREFAVVYSDYNTKLVDLNSLRLQAVAKIHSTGKMYSDDYEFRLDNKDSIDIRVRMILLSFKGLIFRVLDCITCQGNLEVAI